MFPKWLKKTPFLEFSKGFPEIPPKNLGLPLFPKNQEHACGLLDIWDWGAGHPYTSMVSWVKNVGEGFDLHNKICIIWVQNGRGNLLQLSRD